MVAAANMVEVAALVGDTARATMLAALMGGQALTASELASLAHVTRPTASGHLGKLTAARLDQRHAKAAQPLLPHRFAAGRAHAGKHQGGGGAGDAGALSAALGAGRRAALRALLLRSSRRTSGRCARRCAGGEEVRRAERGGRRAHRARAKVSLPTSAPISPRRPAAGASSAAPVSIGASGAITSPAWSGRRSWRASSRSTGSPANAAAARCS